MDVAEYFQWSLHVQHHGLVSYDFLGDVAQGNYMFGFEIEFQGVTVHEVLRLQKGVQKVVRDVLLGVWSLFDFIGALCVFLLFADDWVENDDSFLFLTFWLHDFFFFLLHDWSFSIDFTDPGWHCWCTWSASRSSFEI